MLSLSESPAATPHLVVETLRPEQCQLLSEWELWWEWGEFFRTAELREKQFA